MIWAFALDSVPFTKAVRDGETSLGGSESACLGLARALVTRGHEVHIFTTQLTEDAVGLDPSGLSWHHADDFRVMNQFLEWDVVVALRWFGFFGAQPVHARLRILWNQDLLVPGEMVPGVMSCAWAYDRVVYVSEYHQQQWEAIEPALAGIGWTTRNGFDPTHLPKASTKDPNRIIHVSRPERGLGPLLTMWPALKKAKPDATLQICRYSSMYDRGPGSWSDTCAAFDRQVDAVNQAVGGITYLGELNKRQLYEAISDAAVMWYPGVSTFAETSCIAAVEAQACGTPFVGSLKGALVETARPSYDAGLLIAGDAQKDAAYHEASIAAVLKLLDGCARQSFAYRALQRAGKQHVEAYRYAVLAAEWETYIGDVFRQRYESHKVGVLRQLLHEDDHVAASVVAEALGDSQTLDFCEYVIAGKDHTAEQYGDAALDPIKEMETSGRFKAVWPMFEGKTRVLDVACGNGSFAIGLALAHPELHVYGLDYAEANIKRATEAAEHAGVGERCHFERLTVYNFDTIDLHNDWHFFADRREPNAWFDGLFVGEFVEHVAGYRALIDGLERVLRDGAKVVYTCPHGACAELVPRWMPLHRGHVHRFHHDDLKAVWGPKLDFAADYFAGGLTERGNPIGNWIVSYTMAPNRPAGARPLEARIQRTRPLQKLSVGVITKDAELDLGKCLASVWPVADEIVVGDTGSRDDTKAIAEKYRAKVLDLPPVMDQPEGFAGARNQVLAACTGDWFCWIDADETLIDGHWLRRYLDGPVFTGYVLHQTHLYIDGPPTLDRPVRVFRTGRGIQFYGCVHEQPQQGDCNTDIFPTLEPYDVKLAHTGYLTERTRVDKRELRNRPLLIRDQEVFKDRVLGKVLCLREAVIEADLARSHGNMARANRGYLYAIKVFVEYFDDPTHKYHKLARPWYQSALQHLGLGLEFEVSMAGQRGGLGQHRATVERIWVRDWAEAERIQIWKLAELKKQMTSPIFHTDPFVLPVRADEQVPA